MKIRVIKHKLKFKFEAGTSRGVMTFKDSWFIQLYDTKNPDIFGIGECGPLKCLSPDLTNNLGAALEDCVQAVYELDAVESLDTNKIISEHFPALRFALETAVLDLKNGGRRILFENSFSKSLQSIPINGLVWMGDKELMIQRIENKINDGFDCMKIKIGAINFEDELALLKYIRTHFSANDVTIRLDANGAFNSENVLSVLNQLSAYDIHSIEQPIMAGDWSSMRKLCAESPIPIALDEELIGIHGSESITQLLDEIRPAYVILKPTLLGGLHQCGKWIKLAESMHIGWWITSALESNIGLNAIAQFTANYPIEMPQGLGTGQLFHNNIGSPLAIENGTLVNRKGVLWDLSQLG